MHHGLRGLDVVTRSRPTEQFIPKRPKVIGDPQQKSKLPENYFLATSLVKLFFKLCMKVIIKTIKNIQGDRAANAAPNMLCGKHIKNFNRLRMGKHEVIYNITQL